MASTEMEKRKREEYEMQLFGFHSGMVYDTIKSMIRETVQSRISKLIESLEKKYAPQGDDYEKLQRNKEALTKAYYRGIAIYLPAIENCINKIISIPQHVLLAEDKIQETQYTTDDLLEAEANVKKLRLEIKQTITLNMVLKQELQIANDFQKNIDTANMLCNSVETESNYPEIDTNLVELMDHYRSLKRNYREQQPIPDVRNKEKCVKKEPLPFENSFL